MTRLGVSPARAALVAGLLVAAAALIILFSGGGASYTIRAQFTNAGGLVPGGEVRVAGREVGSISSLRLTPSGLVDAYLKINDSSIVPLHQGTRASIRSVGQATITNNFVDLSPGPANLPSLSNGALLSTEQTSGIVNIDDLLQSFGPSQRANLSGLIEHGAQLYAGSGSRYFNAMLGKLSPALGQLSNVAGDLDQDQSALVGFIRTAGQATAAIASRSQDLQSAVVNTAKTFGALASERRSLDSLLEGAPAVLDQATGTLQKADTAVTAIRPDLREVPPVAAPLSKLLVQTAATMPQARAVIGQLRGQLPNLRQSLQGVAPIEPAWVKAFRSAASLSSFMQIAQALRVYGVDLAIGVPNGLAGLAVGNYDSAGHYARLEYVQVPQTTLAGVPPLLDEPPFTTIANETGIFDIKTHQTARCPGAAIPAAPDGSSPWDPIPSLCDLSETPPLSIDQP